jgi:hypothetical protein
MHVASAGVPGNRIGAPGYLSGTNKLAFGMKEKPVGVLR